MGVIHWFTIPPAITDLLGSWCVPSSSVSPRDTAMRKASMFPEGIWLAAQEHSTGGWVTGQPVVSDPGSTFSEDNKHQGTFRNISWKWLGCCCCYYYYYWLKPWERVTVSLQACYLHCVNIVYANLLKIQASSYREILINRNIFIDFQILEI